MQLHFTRKAV